MNYTLAQWLALIGCLAMFWMNAQMFAVGIGVDIVFSIYILFTLSVAVITGLWTRSPMIGLSAGTECALVSLTSLLLCSARYLEASPLSEMLTIYALGSGLLATILWVNLPWQSVASVQVPDEGRILSTHRTTSSIKGPET